MAGREAHLLKAGGGISASMQGMFVSRHTVVG